jgi:hypothetical protein
MLGYQLTENSDHTDEITAYARRFAGLADYALYLIFFCKEIEKKTEHPAFSF